jgi:hypothetical protein
LANAAQGEDAMHLSKYALLLGLLITIFFTGLMGGHFGYTVNGVPQSGNLSASEPGILGVLSWSWEGIKFMFSMVTFRVDGMPAFVSVIFVIMSIMTIFLIVSLIRGND